MSFYHTTALKIFFIMILLLIIVVGAGSMGILLRPRLTSLTHRPRPLAVICK